MLDFSDFRSIWDFLGYVALVAVIYGGIHLAQQLFKANTSAADEAKRKREADEKDKEDAQIDKDRSTWGW